MVRSVKQHVMLRPLFKYPGGKGSEYKHLKKLFPRFTNFVEPFVGGGAVYWATDAEKMIINDYSQELIAIYRYAKAQDGKFLSYVNDIGVLWEDKDKVVDGVRQLLFERKATVKKPCTVYFANQLLAPVRVLDKNQERLALYLDDSIKRKIRSLERVAKTKEITNFEENVFGAVGAAIYTYLRAMYNETEYDVNPQLKTALYLFLREYAYSSMFRFNSSGGFNVPFGGNTYAQKSFYSRINQITNSDVIAKLKKTKILQGDFSHSIIDDRETFMFLDPPYDTEFSTYNLKVFDSNEQIRLRDSLLNVKHTKWLLVVKSTDFIENLYEREGWYKARFDKSYSVNFNNRNNRDAEHLIVTNYDFERQ